MMTAILHKSRNFAYVFMPESRELVGSVALLAFAKRVQFYPGFHKMSEFSTLINGIIDMVKCELEINATSPRHRIDAIYGK